MPLADIVVPEPPEDAWLSTELSVAVLVFVALVVLVVAASIRILRRMRERSAAMAAWTERLTRPARPFGSEETREFAVTREPGQVTRHRARNERAMAARVSNAGSRFAASVARVRGRS